MMNLFIRVKNGQAFEHPIFEDNFKAAFPGIDIDDLPKGFARFERIAAPAPGAYQVYEGVTYEQVGDIYRDVHHFREMTSDEVASKQKSVKDGWATSPNWASWTFNEETCSYDPPIPMPEDETLYAWDEETNRWVSIDD